MTLEASKTTKSLCVEGAMSLETKTKNTNGSYTKNWAIDFLTQQMDISHENRRNMRKLCNFTTKNLEPTPTQPPPHCIDYIWCGKSISNYGKITKTIQIHLKVALSTHTHTHMPPKTRKS